jgi:NADPH2:quinone reductase
MTQNAQTMKAAVAGEKGLDIREVPRPRPKPNEVLVRVRVADLNRADLAGARHLAGATRGHAEAIFIPGLDWAGDVAEVGSEVTGIKVGDKVMCSGQGGYAEYAVSDWGRVLPFPAGKVSYEQAATFPVALITMHDALATNGRLKRGETVLIQGASSGVGLMGLQIAKHLGARLVIGSSTNADRRKRLAEFGCDLAVDTTQPEWVEQVTKATGGKGVDLVVDMISGKLTNQTLQATSILGRIVNVGRLGGTKAEFDFNLHALRRIDYIGVTFRTRSVEEVREIGRRMRADLWEGIAAGKFKLPVDKVFPLDQAEQAQAHMRANAHFGKILLTVAD